MLMPSDYSYSERRIFVVNTGSLLPLLFKSVAAIRSLFADWYNNVGFPETRSPSFSHCVAQIMVYKFNW